MHHLAESRETFGEELGRLLCDLRSLLVGLLDHDVGLAVLDDPLDVGLLVSWYDDEVQRIRADLSIGLVGDLNAVLAVGPAALADNLE